MPEPRRWISRIRTVEPPELWDDVERRAADGRSRAAPAPRTPSRRVGALLTGIASGAVALILVIVALGKGPATVEHRTDSVGVSPSPSTSPSPAPRELDPVTLTASVDEPPATWDEVAFVPTGEAGSELGDRPCYHCEIPIPSALAVGRDGSFWIADPQKHRVAHFAEDGAFLGAVPVDPGPDDLVFVGDRLYVLPAIGGSRIATVEGDHLAEPITVNHEGRALHVWSLIGGQGELLVLINGAERLLGGYWAFASVDPATGEVTPSLGVLTHQGTRADFVHTDTRPATYELRWSLDDRPTAVQDYLFELVRAGRTMRATVGDAYLRPCTGGGVATLLSVGDRQGNPVGIWYLEISALAKPPVFERVSEVALDRRSLTFGPEGVYLMRLRDDGVHIYVR